MSGIVFSTAPLEADSLLWGSFWQGDVISAGYTLPALELCFLREARLTQTTDALSPQEYLAQMQHLLQKKAFRQWHGHVCGQAVRCVFSSGVMMWVTGDTLVAGYGSPPVSVPGYGIKNAGENSPQNTAHPTEKLQIYAAWVAEQLPHWGANWGSLSLAARTDHVVQAHRAFTLLDGIAQSMVADWLVKFAHQ